MSSSTPERTPRQKLEDWRAKLSRALYLAIARAETTQAAVAEACGVGHQKVQIWCDPNRPEVPSLAHLALFPRAVLVDLLAPVMEAQVLLAIDRPKGEGDFASHIQDVQALNAELGDVTKSYLAALATHGGVITDEEKRLIVREMDEAIAKLAASRQMFLAQLGHARAVVS